MARGQAISIYNAVDPVLAPGAMVLEQQVTGAAPHEAVIFESRSFGRFIKGATHHNTLLGLWVYFLAVV